MTGGTYLDRIVARHRESAQLDGRSTSSLVESCAGLPPTRGFIDRIRRDSASGLSVIAEIKRRSPSKGDLNVALDPAETARMYAAGGASCLSVLTDVDHFGGSVADLKAARAAVDLPVLRKDFTVSANDVVDARLMGADCVLLIAAALTVGELASFHALASDVGIDVLVEIHDEAELEVALNVGASMIGVNQRDLVTFRVDHERAVRMASLIPADVVRVAESGVRDAVDASSLKAAGYHAVLVGESVVTSPDPIGAVAALRAARPDS